MTGEPTARLHLPVHRDNWAEPTCSCGALATPEECTIRRGELTATERGQLRDGGEQDPTLLRWVGDRLRRAWARRARVSPGGIISHTLRSGRPRRAKAGDE